MSSKNNNNNNNKTITTSKKQTKKQVNSQKGGSMPNQKRSSPLVDQATFRNPSQNVGAAVFRRVRQIGIQDFRDIRISALIGYTYVGNNTLGANGSVYFVESTAAKTILPVIPVLLSDSVLGQVYVTDIFKHFERVVIKDGNIHFDSIQPATTNNMSVVAAAARGYGDTVNCASHTDTTATVTDAKVISMSGAISFPSYENATINLKRYIAGGSGANQNEFQIQALIAQTTVVSQSSPGVGLVPCTFSVGGTCATAGMYGTTVHRVIVELWVDLLDFIGGQTSADNPG